MILQFSVQFGLEVLDGSGSEVYFSARKSCFMPL